jgi:hypothetical protein
MKLLKEGKVEKFIGQCDNCGAVYECLPRELKLIHKGDKENNYQDYAKEYCSYCTFGEICFYKENSKKTKQLFEIENLND